MKQCSHMHLNPAADYFHYFSGVCSNERRLDFAKPKRLTGT